MARLSKKLIKDHEKVLSLLEKSRDLTQDEVLFVLENWTPKYGGHISKNAAFFTPLDIASELVVMTTNVEGRLLDLGAGIGNLIYTLKAHSLWRWDRVDEMIAIEINPTYVEVGKKLFPEVTWICGSMFDLNILRSIGKVDSVVSNPPFGKPESIGDTSWLRYQGPAHLMAVEVAARMASRGAGFILPQSDLPFKYSGNQSYITVDPEYYSSHLTKFVNTWPEITLFTNSTDLSFYEWKDAPPCDVVDIEYMADINLPPLPQVQLQLL